MIYYGRPFFQHRLIADDLAAQAAANFDNNLDADDLAEAEEVSIGSLLL